MRRYGGESSAGEAEVERSRSGRPSPGRRRMGTSLADYCSLVSGGRHRSGGTVRSRDEEVDTDIQEASSRSRRRATSGAPVRWHLTAGRQVARTETYFIY